MEHAQIPPPIRALLLDDSSFDRARIKRMASRTDLPIILDEVSSIAEMDAAAERSSYDLFLIDYRLPEGDGLAALDRIKNAPLNCGAGTIMITGNGALDTAVSAMRRGCHDFLTKDVMDAATLRTAMMNAMSAAAEQRDAARQIAHQREVIRLGLTDALMDREVQGTVVSLMKQHYANTVADRPAFHRDLSAAEIDALLAGMNEDDEFIFH